jgi:protein TonB
MVCQIEGLPLIDKRPVAGGAGERSNSPGTTTFLQSAETWEKPLLCESSSARVFVGLTVSILIHAAIVAGLATSFHRIGRIRPPDDRYFYITVISPQSSVADSNGREAESPGLERRTEFAHNSRRLARLHRRAEQVRRRVQKMALPLRVAAVSKVAAPIPSSALAKPASARNQRISTNNDGTAGQQIAHAGRKSSAGAASGTIASQGPVLLSRIIPTYPEHARTLGVEGQVVLRFIVDESGRVERDIKVIASIPMLDQAAIDAVRQWRFAPALDRSGNPVPAAVSVPLQFTLQ